MAVKRFRKKPVVIEAIKYVPHDNCAEIMVFMGVDPTTSSCAVDDDVSLMVYTLEGMMEASPGDWIIKGIAGEFYPCKPDIFEKSYEEVTDA